MDSTAAMFMAGFFAVSLYAVVDVNVQIFSTFRRYRGLYFWSLLFASWGIVLHAIGFLLKFFRLCHNDYINITIITLGGVPMVIGQSVVLYSRLGLVSATATGDRQENDRWVLFMILVSFLLFTMPPTVLNYGTNSPNLENFLPLFKIWERIAMVGFCVVEFTISGLYLWRTQKMLVSIRKVQSGASRTKSVMNNLIVSHCFPYHFHLHGCHPTRSHLC